ncbi:hydroxyacylglutathione hydrolase [Pseudaestuariivita sp.]|uniref:hydroxyacylglutathione hydrolase n=1 Tax=Pseudaestuariivita sp. TaxID=2211669 RepID=UPI0040591F60
MPLEFHQFAYNDDNYGVLIHDPVSAETACVDVGDATALAKALDHTGWTLSQIWITHHHWDHTDGLDEAKETTGATVLGPVSQGKDIAGLDRHLADGDTFAFAGHKVQVLHTPGHTTDMINFYLPEAGVVFTGDTLFAMGCGRLFEGTPAMMWTSLQKLMALPEETVVYCAHEYTAANAAFAVTVDPGNAALEARAKGVAELRAAGKPTVPTRMGIELATNPFLRASSAGLRAHLGMTDATDAEVFTRLRALKDQA